MSALLRRYQVEHLVGLKKSAIYKMIREGKFPKPVRISDRAVAWRQEEVEQWIKSREVVEV